MQWEVTPRCNHNCVHCYNYWRSTSDVLIENRLYDEIASKIINLHPVYVVITGGEPLLVFEEIKPQIEKFIDNKISVSLNTNASLITDEIAMFLKKYNIPVLVSLPCSNEAICNDITNTNNAFFRTTRGISILINAGVTVTVNMVVMKSNVNYIYDTAKFVVEELGVKSFFASRVGKPINARVEFEKELLDLSDLIKLQSELLRIKKDFNIRIGTAGPIPACSITNDNSFQEFAYEKNCSAGKVAYSIDTNGNVKACPRDSKIYGNILSDDFSLIWEKMGEWRDETLLPIDCRRCSVKKYCGGGCRLDAFPFTNKRDSLDSMSTPDKLPVNFKKNRRIFDFCYNETFFVPNTLVYIQEDFGFRVSNFGKVLYITDKMKIFLEKNKYFTIFTFANVNNISLDEASSIINLLLNNNILYTEKTYLKLNKEVSLNG